MFLESSESTETKIMNRKDLKNWGDYLWEIAIISVYNARKEDWERLTE